jgi:hypothetical protein
MEHNVDVRALGMLVGLDIAVEYRAGVAAQYLALMAQADLVLSASLPDELEPAPVFLP